MGFLRVECGGISGSSLSLPGIGYLIMAIIWGYLGKGCSPQPDQHTLWLIPHLLP